MMRTQRSGKRVIAAIGAFAMACTGIGALTIVASQPAYADVNPNVVATIRPLVLADNDGNEIPGAAAQVEDPVRMYVEWDATNANPQPGQSFTVGLPTTGMAEPDITHFFRYREVGRRDPLVFNGTTVGECVTDADVMTCTFNAAITAQTNVKGTMNQMLMAQKETPLTVLPFDANGVSQSVPNPNNAPITQKLWEEFNVYKYANSLKRDSTEIKWNIYGSGRRLSERSGAQPGTYVNEVTFVDVVGADGQTLVENEATWTLRVNPKVLGTKDFKDVAAVGRPNIDTTWGSYTLERVIAADGKSATITLRRTDGTFDPTINYEISYRSQLNGPVIPGYVYSNTAKLVGDTEAEAIHAEQYYKDPISYTIEMKPGYGAFGVKKYLVGAEVGDDDNDVPSSTMVKVSVAYNLPAGWDPAQHPDWVAPAGGANPYVLTVPVEQGVAGHAFPVGTEITLTEDLSNATLPHTLKWDGEPLFVVDGNATETQTTFVVKNETVSAVALSNTVAAVTMGKFAITKSVVGEGIPSNKTFNFTYTCDGGIEGTITDVIPGQPKESADIPVGAICTITEDDGAVEGYTLVTSAIDPVTITAAVTEVKVTNTYTKTPPPPSTDKPKVPVAPGGALAKTGGTTSTIIAGSIVTLLAGGCALAMRRRAHHS